MKMMKGSCLRALICKWRKLSKVVSASTSCKNWWWVYRPCFDGDDEPIIPRDVPKGHLVVYVGEDQKRFIIRVSFLDHPLFRELLDRAREEYGFSPDMKLCIPCDENMFLSIVRSVG